MNKQRLLLLLLIVCFLLAGGVAYATNDEGDYDESGVYEEYEEDYDDDLEFYEDEEGL